MMNMLKKNLKKYPGIATSSNSGGALRRSTGLAYGTFSFCACFALIGAKRKRRTAADRYKTWHKDSPQTHRAFAERRNELFFFENG